VEDARCDRCGPERAAVARLRRGDLGGLEALVQLHQVRALRAAYLVTRDRALAEELTAETFEKALRTWKRFDPQRASAKTWLCQIARSRALDHFRAERRRRRREDLYAVREPAEHEEVFGRSLPPWLERALASLSAGEREVIALRILLGLDGASTARLLGISPTACSTRLNRALTKLEEKARTHVIA
jgi:RNA polymerase sigma-70 factor (ECF subfamily)